MQKPPKKKANASSTDPRDWPMKKRVPAFLNAVFGDPASYKLEMIEGEYCVTPKASISTTGCLVNVVIESHRYSIATYIVADRDKARLYLYNDCNHPTLDQLSFATKIEA